MDALTPQSGPEQTPASLHAGDPPVNAKGSSPLLTGYRKEQAIGHRPSQLVASGLQRRAYYDELWRTILSGQAWRGESRCARRPKRRSATSPSTTRSRPCPTAACCWTAPGRRWPPVRAARATARSCCSTLTTSRRSTTPGATMSATSC